MSKNNDFQGIEFVKESDPEIECISVEQSDSKIDSPTTMLIQDIVNGILETGSPPYSDTLFVDKEFSFFEPKKKDRLLGECRLVFPKNCYVGIFTSKRYQFYSKESLLDFLSLSGLDTTDPYEICVLVTSRFPECPIGIVGGHQENQPGSTYNVIWKNENTRFYYSPYERKIVDIVPVVIVI